MTYREASSGRAPKAVIAEDEPLLADELREQFGALWPQLEIVAVEHDGIAALRAIETHAPDIALLDIRMPRMTGLDVARQVSGRCHVAFISAYDQHAIAAFEAGGVDYVLKPIAAARLATTVDRLKARSKRPRPTCSACSSSSPPARPWAPGATCSGSMHRGGRRCT